MILKEPWRDYKRAPVVSQPWPFRHSTVALLQFRKTEMRKPADFFGVLKPVFHSGWRILVDACSSILFTTVR